MGGQEISRGGGVKNKNRGGNAPYALPAGDARDLALVCSLQPILNTVFFHQVAWPSRQRKNFREFPNIQAIVQLWLLLKQQANKH